MKASITKASVLLAASALTWSTPIAAQVAGDANFPFPAAGEFGPGPYVDDNLTIADHLITGPSHTTGEMAPDVVGAFRFDCPPGQVLADDPVVYPGKPGASPHIHQFYGNVSTTGLSTYATQRTVGLSTCVNSLNRSGYWAPALVRLVNGKPMVQRPEYNRIYYKREPKGSPACTPGNAAYIGECVGIPDGMDMIFGYDMISGTVANGQKLFKCVSPQNVNRSGFTDDLPTAAASCQNGDHMDFYIESSPCWDKLHLDSPNHRSHVHDLVNGKCPSTHPAYMPHFVLQADYLVDDSLNKSGSWSPGQATWYLASDIMFGMPAMRPGTTLHADYFEGWKNVIKKAWTDGCIDRMLNCSAGDLGNGFQMKQEWPLLYTADNPGSRFVPLPAGKIGPFLGNKLHATQ